MAQLDQLVRSRLSHQGEQRPVLLVAGGVEAGHVLALEGLHLAPESRRGMRVGMAGAVSERDHRPPRHRAGLVQVALQPRHRPPSRRRHLLLLEGGLQSATSRSASSARSRSSAGTVSASDASSDDTSAAELRAHRLDQVVHVLRGPSPRAAPEQVHRVLRKPRLAARVFAGARRQRKPGMEEGQPAPLDGHDREPRGQLLDAQRGQRDVRRAHASTSPGSRVTTLRRWARRSCARRGGCRRRRWPRSGRAGRAWRARCRASAPSGRWCARGRCWWRARAASAPSPDSRARSSSRAGISSSQSRDSSAQSELSARAGSTPGFSFSEISKRPGSTRQLKYTCASTHNSCSYTSARLSRAPSPALSAVSIRSSTSESGSLPEGARNPASTAGACDG